LKNDNTFNLVLEKLLESIKDWPGTINQETPLLRAFNTSGSQSPIFWCFQSPEEFEILAHALGPDVPLYAFRSGHLLMDYTDNNINQLSRLFAEHIIQTINTYEKNTTFTLAGNCQGAGLIQHVYQHLKNTHLGIDNLILLESTFPQVVDAKVKLIFGRDSSYNPYKKYLSPDRGLSRYYKHYSTHIIPCKHGMFFSEQNIAYLVDIIVDGSLRIEYFYREFHAIKLAKQIHQSKITINSACLTLFPGQEFNIPIKIKNTSPVDWEKNYFFIASHWFNKSDGSYFSWIDRYLPISEFSAGQTQTVNFSLSSPNAPGDYYLEFDLVDDGISWFREKGNEISSLEVTVKDKEDAFQLSQLTIHDNTLIQDKLLSKNYNSGALDQVIQLFYHYMHFSISSTQKAILSLASNFRHEEAITVCEQLLQHNPQERETLSHQLNSYLYLRNFQKVKEKSLNALKHFPDDSEFNKFFLISQVNLGSFNNLSSLKNYSLNHQDMINVLNVIYAKSKNYSGSIDPELIAKRLLEINHSVGAYLKYSTHLIEKKKYSLAEKILREGIKYFPYNYHLTFRLAESIRLSRGDKEAISYYLKTISLLKEHRKSYTRLILYYADENKQRAIEYCQQALLLFKDDNWFKNKYNLLTS